MSRFVSVLLYGVEPHDPTTLFTAVALLSAVAGVAAGLPAHRAVRADPAAVLRES
jgi:ABC-type lipoprotein release transport system permease subunit